MKLWWLSFVDDRKPIGDRFNGVVVIYAKSLTHAAVQCWELGINPGGEVLGTILPHAVPERFMNRLLNKALVAELQTLLPEE